MNVELITMDADAARAAYRDYRAAVRERHNAEDAEIAQGYKEIAKGHPLINLVDALDIAGLDEKGYPRIAIARASAQEVWCCIENGTVTFSEREYFSSHATRQYIRVPHGAASWQRRLSAVVPMVPPALRPKDKLSNYFILFEPVWKKAPNPDPLLLKRLNRFTFAVLAQWDLTPVELMVLQGRVQA